MVLAAVRKTGAALQFAMEEHQVDWEASDEQDGASRSRQVNKTLEEIFDSDEPPQ